MIEIIIDKEKYKLPTKNYNRKSKKKSQIVVGNTFSSDMNHYEGWVTRCNGEFKRTAAFTIDINGKIYQHYDPKYSSQFLPIKKANENIIPVMLENVGWLMKDFESGKFYTWVGNEFTNEELIIEKRWRNHVYWASYSSKQLDSLVKLSRYLSEKFNIPLRTIGHNTKVDGIYEYMGVTFRSNYIKYCTDLNPAFDYDKFKNKLEYYG
jgi:N-acetyl-anhydromuramyl-L-alanine amidase AmpD